MKVVTRSEWGATAKLGPPMTLPVSELWLHHSVTQLTDDPHADMKVIERIGVSRFGRFSYSWAYHAKARLLLEGAGNTVGAHTAGRNSTSLGLVLIGDYTNEILTDDGVADLRWAVQWLIAGNRLKPGVYPTGGHRDLKATACPGNNAYGRIADIQHAPAPPTPIIEETTMFVVRRVEDGTIAYSAGPGHWVECNPEEATVAHALVGVQDAIPVNARQYDVARSLQLR